MQNSIPVVNINSLIDEAQCYKTVREMRWSSKNDRVRECQSSVCKSCGVNFDDLTDTVFSGHHQPLSKWIMCLYLMGLNLSNRQIGQELDVNESDCQKMTKLLREAVYEKNPDVLLVGEVECDEVYIVAGHKGQPEMVKKGNANQGATV